MLTARLHVFLDRHAHRCGVLLLSLLALAPVYLYFHYPAIADPEYPGFETLIYSSSPPPAYRVVREDGFVETATAMLHGGAMALAVIRVLQCRRAGRRSGVWPLVLGFGFFFWWRELGPEPPIYDLHAFSFKYLLDPRFTWDVRLVYGAAAWAVIAAVAAWVFRKPARTLSDVREDWRRPSGRLLALGFGLMLAAQLWDRPLPSWLRPEPRGYVEEWAEAFGALALVMSALDRFRFERRAELGPGRPASRWVPLDGVAALAGMLVVWNVTSAVLWARSPLYHFGTVVDGLLYRSGQPRYRDLWLAQKYYGFRTIVNLHEPGKSPYWEEEQRFAREHGIRVVTGGPGFGEFMGVLNDVHAWPILVHCRTGFHRTTATLGVYWFAYERRPLEYVFEQVEQITGKPTKPKFIDQLVKNLPRAVPERFPDGTCQIPPARVRVGGN